MISVTSLHGVVELGEQMVVAVVIGKAITHHHLLGVVAFYIGLDCVGEFEDTHYENSYPRIEKRKAMRVAAENVGTRCGR